MNDDEGWFEIEEEVPVSCGDMFRAGQHDANVQHEFGTHTRVVTRKMRLTAQSIARLRIFVKREAEPDPRLYGWSDR